ncbi:MAG: hypothetical protein KF687_13775 [Cyclobacteriaceae bacterium]|nr:hypothetical protein [Cyclobacteriaceae bacterium]
MNTILFLLLSISILYGQTPPIPQSTNKLAGNSKYYVSFPPPPTYNDVTLIRPTDQFITPSDLGGKPSVLLGAGVHRPSVNLSDLDNIRILGTETDFANIINADLSDHSITRIGDNSTGTGLWLRGSLLNNVDIYNLWAYGGQSTVSASLSSRSFSLNRVRISDGGFSGVMAKTDNTILKPYNIKLNFVHIKRMLGEATYIGQTNGTVYHQIDTLSINHLFADSIGREGLQLNHVRWAHINKSTFLRLGFDTPSGAAQRNCAQIGDTFGLIENSVFVHNFNDTTGLSSDLRGLVVDAYGITFRNIVIIAPGPVYIGNLEAREWWNNSYQKQYLDSVGSIPITFENCSFRISEPFNGKLFRVFSNVADVIVKNCSYSDNITALFDDGRTDKATYRLIDGGGNLPVAPMQIPFPEVDSLGRMINDYYYTRGIGWLTPD